MSDITNEKLNKKLNRNKAAYTKEFIVTESYRGIKKLSDIFADLLYSEFCRQKSYGLNGGSPNYTAVLPTTPDNVIRHDGQAS
jgi:hypothetical protein